jgi:hypothetical protein
MRAALLGFLLALWSANALAALPSAAETARAIREAGLDPEMCFRVRDLSYSKDEIRLYFNDGYLIFSRPVAGERLTAVFTTDVEGGDGEVLLLPPLRSERQSLAKYTKSPNLDEHFRTALLVFTDGAGETLLNRINQEGAGRKAPEMGPSLADQWSPVVSNISDGFALRLVQDLLSPARAGGGFFLAALAGKTLGNFDVVHDPRMAEQIVTAQLNERNNRVVYDVWASFAARPYRTGAAKALPPDFSIEEFRIGASLDESLRMQATTRATFRIGAAAQRMLAFEISRAMEVTGARIDGVPAELLRRESPRGRALHPGENDVFLVAAPEVLAAGSRHQIEFAHEGAVIASPGKGVYYVGARSNWYPNTGDSFATFELNFRYPKRLILVTPGEVVEDRTEGDWRITRRLTPRIKLAGFNLGEYEKVSGEAPGFAVDVYGNRNLEPALRPPPQQTIVVEPRPNARGVRGGGLTTIVQTPATPDPLARLKTVANDVSAALQFFSGLFGPPPLRSLTVSPIPDTFGQGFPGLIYLSTLAYLDPSERPASARGPRQQVFFSDVIQAHEVAHQWWGGVVGPENYQDDWLIESLAQYSALLWIEKKKGAKAMQAVLEDYRDDLIKEDQDGQTLESAGPLTWGYRLDWSRPEAWRAITYEKGAWVLHMLRLRIGDARFLKLLAEARRRYEFRSMSTRDFQALARESLPPRIPADALDAFFENWVYSTGVPALRLKTSKRGVAPAIKLTGTVEQSGVDNDFSVEVPVEIQFAKSAPQVVWVRTSNEPAPFSVTLKEIPLKVTIPAGVGVLARK